MAKVKDTLPESQDVPVVRDPIDPCTHVDTKICPVSCENKVKY